MVSGYGRYKDKTETHVQRIAIESFLLQPGFHGSRFCDVYVTFRGDDVASAVCCCRLGLNLSLALGSALLWPCCGLCQGPFLVLLWPLLWPFFGPAMALLGPLPWPFSGPVVAFAFALLRPCCGLCLGPSLALFWLLPRPFSGPLVTFALALLWPRCGLCLGPSLAPFVAFAKALLWPCGDSPALLLSSYRQRSFLLSAGL